MADWTMCNIGWLGHLSMDACPGVPFLSVPAQIAEGVLLFPAGFPHTSQPNEATDWQRKPGRVELHARQISTAEAVFGNHAAAGTQILLSTLLLLGNPDKTRFTAFNLAVQSGSIRNRAWGFYVCRQPAAWRWHAQAGHHRGGIAAGQGAKSGRPGPHM